jgi:5-methyltetrahydrofolate--homocysteine methyltransferase
MIKKWKVMDTLSTLTEAVIQGNIPDSAALAQRALAEGHPPLVTFEEALIPAMDLVGEKMRANEYYIPEVLMASSALEAATEILRPRLVATESLGQRGTVVTGTVEGDLHSIGIGLVSTLLEAAGFRTVFLGTNVTAERFVKQVMEQGADVVALSALLTTTMLRMHDVIVALQEAGLRDRVKIMVGGAPLTASFADEVGADGWSGDAVGAVALAKQWIGTSRTASEPRLGT